MVVVVVAVVLVVVVVVVIKPSLDFNLKKCQAMWHALVISISVLQSQTV